MMTQETLTLIEKPTHYRIPVYKVALVRESTLSQLQRPQIRTAGHAAEILMPIGDQRHAPHGSRGQCANGVAYCCL